MEGSKKKFDYKTLPTKQQYVWQLCRQVMQDLKNGNGCTEEEINDIMVGVDARAKGYIHPDDFMSSDKAIKELGVHRNQFFSLIKEYGVECEKLNGHPIGYHKDDIRRIHCAMKNKK